MNKWLKTQVKFTRASKKDVGITVRTNALAYYMTDSQKNNFFLACKNSNNRFVIDVHGIPTIFTASRGGSTLYSHNLHPSIDLPQVGSPCYFMVGLLRIENISSYLMGK